MQAVFQGIQRPRLAPPATQEQRSLLPSSLPGGLPHLRTKRALACNVARPSSDARGSDASSGDTGSTGSSEAAMPPLVTPLGSSLGPTVRYTPGQAPGGGGGGSGPLAWLSARWQGLNQKQQANVLTGVLILAFVVGAPLAPTG